MARINQKTAARRFTRANLAFQDAGGRSFVTRGGILRNIGPEDEGRELSVCAGRYDRYKVVSAGLNNLGSYTVDLRIVHNPPLWRTP